MGIFTRWFGNKKIEEIKTDDNKSIKDINDIDAIQQQERTLEDIEKALELTQEMDNFIKNKVNYIFGYDVK